MALVFDSSMQYEEDEVFEGEVEGEGEGEETNIVELARIIPYLCSSQMNPVWQVCMMLPPFPHFDTFDKVGLRQRPDTD